MTRTKASNSSATILFRSCPGRPSIAANTWVPPHLGFFDIRDDWGPLGIPRDRQRLNGLNPALPAEIKLLQVFFLTRGTERKSHQVPSRCNPAEGCGSLKPPLTGIVLREKSANDNGRNNVGECTNASENKTPLRAETPCLLHRATVIVRPQELSLSAIILSIHVIG